MYETRNGNIRIKYFLKKEGGKVLEPTVVGSVWDIPDMMHLPKAECTGWTTQKPLALLQRIIKASSNEGDVVLDLFAGCASACVAGKMEGRQWVGIEACENAVDIIQVRLDEGAWGRRRAQAAKSPYSATSRAAQTRKASH